MEIDVDKINVILATDCGSTTSKARFFRKVGNEYRYVSSGEAPTTVEAPYEDVTYGIINAIKEVEEITGQKIIGAQGIISPSNGSNEGVDLYVTTSSAGGGLQMIVTGVVAEMTAESANRAALGAGAVVMDVLAIDDGRKTFQKLERIRNLRPDMILLAGGTDGGTIKHVVETAELIETADPKARLGSSYSLPVVYAGNKDAREAIQERLGKKFSLTIVDNIRPTLEEEHADPARNAIHELFMEHVMSHAPGYTKLMKWTPIPILPTPAGEGMMFRVIAETYKVNVIGVGLGGATTNVYSVFDGRFVRSVSANLGMSYSIGNVISQAGAENILRWLPFEMNEEELRDSLYNKMIRPTTIPDEENDLIIEHAVAREALRMGFQHHKFLATPLRGAMRYHALSMGFQYIETYLDMMKIQWLVGTGGLLSHAPKRVQTALILIDGFQPEGITRLAQDSVFMMPHLGVVSTVHPKAAMEIFDKDCLVRLGTCIAPKGEVKEGEEKRAGSITITTEDSKVVEEDLVSGTIKRVELGERQKAIVKVRPSLGFDCGNGAGREIENEVFGGVLGLIIDVRGRPISLPKDEKARMSKVKEWLHALDVYQKVL